MEAVGVSDDATRVEVESISSLSMLTAGLGH